VTRAAHAAFANSRAGWRLNLMHSVYAGFSRAMYSNWFWHRPLQLVVDAGEGLPLALGTNVFAPAIVAITHGHSDHVLGLPGFAGARRFGKGATAKPWTVVYPAGTSGVEAIRAMIGSLWRDVIFPITWLPLPPGGALALSDTRRLESFAVAHVEPGPAVGYRVIEQRRRLKAEYAGLPQDAIEQAARRDGRAALMEAFDHVVFAHSGDAMPIEPALASGADLLVHDATFLAADERREPIHATSVEALDVARAAGASTLVLTHLSIRYDRADAIARLREQVAASGFRGRAFLLDESAFIDLRG
jgi:ribonuclease Z